MKLFSKARTSIITGLQRSSDERLEFYAQAGLVALRSVHVTVGRLWKLFVGNHLVLDANKELFKSVCRVPAGKHMELVFLNKTVLLVDAGQVDLRSELNLGWVGWVVLSAGYVQHVNAVVEVRVGRTNNRSVPVCERFVVTLVKTVADALVTKLGVLGLLKLLVEPEGAGHWN